jgi:hypothetical protein
MVTIQTVTFGLCGLSISFLHGGNKNTISFDAFATCDKLQQLGIIKDFDKEERTGEPLVKVHENSIFWCDFVNDFKVSNEVAEQVIEIKTSQTDELDLFVEAL